MDIFEHVISKDLSLHRKDIRKNREQLTAILHPDFLEVGASGHQYDFDTIIDLLTYEKNSNDDIHTQEYCATRLSKDVILLTYKLCVLSNENVPHAFSRRSSIWVNTEKGWKIKYHQGTLCDAFLVQHNG